MATLMPTPVAALMTVESYPAASIEAYPAVATPMPPATSEPYPAAGMVTSTPTQRAITATPALLGTIDGEVYIPVVGHLPVPTTTPTLTPTPDPTTTPTPTPTPTIDFAAVRQQLQAQGQELGFAKIGFHVGVGGNREGLDEWMERLDAAGVPFFLKSADDAAPLLAGQQLMQASGVPHTLVYRRSGDEYDVPDYDLPPEEAARQHWALHLAVFPPELDPSVVWLETINEVDKNRSEWLARFALATAHLALRDGYRWAAFGWSSGEPELEHWQSPAMLEFLRLAAANPDRIAIALHEYSFLPFEIDHLYPYKVGRFQLLFQICDQHGIPRPTVLITEWGWAYAEVPPPAEAIADIAWAARMYAPYPQVRGAAIWWLGCCFADIADQAQRLIKPVTEYSLGNYFVIPRPPEEAVINPELYRRSNP